MTFTPPGTWTFVPERVTMKASGKITVQQDGPNAGWTFVGAGVVGGGDQFSVRVHPQGKSLTITNEKRENGVFPYVVVVLHDGKLYTSPPPGAGDSGSERAVPDAMADRPPTVENAPQ